jgi:(S)-ureidoglycine-glyoxylate aminotransferase
MPRTDALPPRLLLGGRLSNPDPRVLRALSTPLIGQFDPAFTHIMDELAELGRRACLSRSARCVPVSGLPEAALEAMLNTLLEPGERVLALGGVGERVADLGRRYGAQVETVSPADLDLSLGGQPARLVVVEHVDATSGDVQPLAQLAEACHAHGARLLVDASLSLGGVELRFDAWGLDAAVAGLEACVGGPAGLSLTLYTEQVEAAFAARRTPPTTSYLDLIQLQAYWSPERLNHHTAPTSLVYAAREALRLVGLEGLDERWARHQRMNAGLRAGLAALGLAVRGSSPVLCVLDGLDLELPRLLRDEYGIVLGSQGQVALLGDNARVEVLLSLLAALEQALLALGRSVTPGAARAAALAAV